MSERIDNLMKSLSRGLGMTDYGYIKQLETGNSILYKEIKGINQENQTLKAEVAELKEFNEGYSNTVKLLEGEIQRLEGVNENILKENYTLTCMNDSLNSSLSKAKEGLEWFKVYIVNYRELEKEYVSPEKEIKNLVDRLFNGIEQTLNKLEEDI